MRADLAGVRDKLKRAKDHFADLDTAIQGWGTAEPEADLFTLDHQPQHKRMVVRHGKVGPNNPDWALIVGDIVHNLRSALDHLVFQLAILEGNDISCCDTTFFPICICKPNFKKAKQFQDLISPTALALIEDLQPYKAADAGQGPIADILWAVHKIDIVDKHRSVLVVGKKFRTADLTYTLDDAPPVAVQVDQSWRPLEDGAEAASIDLSTVAFKSNVENKMRMQGGTEAQIIIDETGCGCDGQEVGRVMKACMARVGEIVDLFESRFFV